MVTFESMYKQGYEDALEDIRDIIDDMLQNIPEYDETRASFYTGMKVALHNVATKTYNIENNN